MMRISFSRLAVATSLLFITPSLFANDAVILLNQMNDALHTLEYQGNLVYVKEGEVSNLSIKHTIESGAEKEVIASLDEGGDDYVKESTVFSLAGMPKITSKMQQVYSFDLGGMGKVAGRPCRIVLARPKDRKRYLQKYCIDLDRSVLLKYSLINQDHKPVERFMFTDFKVLSEREVITESTEPDDSIVVSGTVNSQTTSAKMTQPISVVTAMPNSLMGGVSESMIMDSDTVLPVDNDIEAAAEKHTGNHDQYSEWFFDPLPKGFNIVSADKVKNPQGEDEQIIISDGLSAVSVFISTDDKNDEKRFKPIQSGALNILSKVYEGHAVTLVGEVPESTLHDIFKGIKRATIEE